MRLNVKLEEKKYFVNATICSDANIRSVADYMKGVIDAVFALDETAKISLIPEESNHLGYEPYSLKKDDERCLFLKEIFSKVMNWKFRSSIFWFFSMNFRVAFIVSC